MYSLGVPPARRYLAPTIKPYLRYLLPYHQRGPYLSPHLKLSLSPVSRCCT